MQHKLTLLWREGIISVNPKTGSVEIRQGAHNEMLVVVTREQFDMFLIDVDAAMVAALQIRNPTGVGFGGTIHPIAPKKPKSMDDLTENLFFVAKGWRTIK